MLKVYKTIDLLIGSTSQDDTFFIYCDDEERPALLDYFEKLWPGKKAKKIFTTSFPCYALDIASALNFNTK